MSAALQLPPHRLTVDEFFEWSGQVPGRWQLRDGEPELMNPPAILHGAMQATVARLLGNHLAAAGGRCSVFTGAGVIPKARSDHNFLVPDLAIACGPIGEERNLPQPLVLIELLSPSNERRTRANVWAYTTIPSVREIVLVSTTAIATEVLRRLPDGSWPDRAIMLGAEAALEIEAVGFRCALRELYRGSVFDTAGT
jgi:Uma2 family endonuclease